MPDMMAIVSKAVFEKEAPKARLGAVLPLRIYRSASKHLERLDGKSRLFLVTVRPPDEALWLVAVLEQLDFDGEQWNGARNRVPVSDISALKGQLKFDSGKGIQAKKGALGMSLQTPRVLTPADAELLIKAAGEAPVKAPRPPRPPGPVNLNAHELVSPLPCLCKKCLAAAPETVTVDGATYFRASAEGHERVLWFWVPEALRADLPSVVQQVQARLTAKLKPFKKPGDAPADADADDDDEGDDDEG